MAGDNTLFNTWQSFFDLEHLTVQTFDDVKNRNNKSLAQIFPYSPKRISYLNNEKAGIFFTLNKQEDVWQRSIVNTLWLEYITADLDVAKEEQALSHEELTLRKEELLKKLKTLDVLPKFAIESKNGYQPIWKFSNPIFLPTFKERYEANEEYKQILKGFSDKTGLKSEGDNIARVIRLPDTFHQKNPEDRFLIKFINMNNKNVTIEEFKSAYPCHLATTQSSYAFNQPIKRTVNDILKSGSEQGSRNMEITSVIGSLFSHYDKNDWDGICWQIIQAVNAYYFHPPIHEIELQNTFNSIARTVIKKDPFAKHRNNLQTATTTQPLVVTFDKAYKQKLIAREQHLIKSVRELKVNDPKYEPIHKEWFLLRIKGEELGLFASVIPIENEPWKIELNKS